MAEPIRSEDIAAVLLNDGWHEVTDWEGGGLFTDSLEFETGDGSMIGRGPGFRFIGASGTTMAGPLSSILAVRLHGFA